MDFCTWNRTCAHKLNCGEWDEAGICDYYGHYMRNARAYLRQSVSPTGCSWKQSKPTKAHLVLCEQCKDRFYCWTTEYFDNDALFKHQINVYHETVRKAQEKTNAVEAHQDEQVFCKHQVAGSIPANGSVKGTPL